MLIVGLGASFRAFTVSKLIPVLFSCNVVSQKAVKFQGDPKFQGN